LIACIPTFLLTSPPLLPKDIQQQKEEKEQQEKPNEALGDNVKESLLTEGEQALNGIEDIPSSNSIWRFYAIVSLIGVYLLLYVGAETSYGGWIFTYAVRVYNFEEADAAYLSSVFWASITVGRLIAVPISIYFTPRTILFGDMAGCMISLTLLLVFSYLKNKVLLWILTVTFGFSMASIFATAFSLPSILKITITSKAASVMIVGASIGDMVLPMVAGWILSGIGPQALLLTILGFFVPAVIISNILLFGFNKTCTWPYYGKRDTEAGTNVELKVNTQVQ